MASRNVFRGILFTFILEYISEPVLHYFYMSRDVESVLPHLPEVFFNTSIAGTFTEVKNVCTFATSSYSEFSPLVSFNCIIYSMVSCFFTTM